MTTVADTFNACDTGLIRGLNLQIIDELNLLVPNALVSFEDLSVDVSGAQINAFLQPKAKQSLKLAIEERNTQLVINSAYRTVAQQYVIRRQFELGLCGITAAARPGLSNHEGGLALDVVDPDGWESFFEPHAWRRLGRDFDFPHYDYALLAGSRQDLGTLGIQAFQRLWNKHNPGDQIAEDGSFGPNTARVLDLSPANGFGAKTINILKLNDTGEGVKALQKALGITVDGNFGEKTLAAVKAFQNAKGLSPDGIVGPSTRAALGI